MAVKRQKFPMPVQPRRGAVLNHIISPFQGMRTDVPPQNLSPGETPYAENFVINAGVLESRSAVSKYSGTTAAGWPASNTPALFLQGYDTSDSRWDILLAEESNKTAWGMYSTDAGASWTDDSSTLSYIYPINLSLDATLIWSWTQFYEPDSQENALAVTSNTTLPMYRVLDASSDWTHFSDIISHESKAAFVESFDNRLIFFNTTDASGTNGTRVRWSVRGDPTDFTSIGAGFEDLLDMKGVGTGLEVEEDRLVLFSEHEIWLGRPRRDAYAFDFDVIEKDRGTPYSDTIVRTPVGIIFLGEDMNFYRVQGNVVRQFSPDVQRFLRDAVDTDYVKAQYDSSEGMYMLFFKHKEDGLTRPRGMFMRVKDIRQDSTDPTKDKADWMYQNMPGSLAAPHRVTGHDNFVIGIAGNYIINPVAHLHQDWYYDTDQFPQGLSHIWTSPAVHASKDPEIFEGISEILVDYNYKAASSASTMYMRALNRSSQATGFRMESLYTVELEGTPDVPLAGIASISTADLQTMKTAFFPMTPEAARYSQFMLYSGGDFSGDEPEAKLTIHNIHATIRPWTGRRPY